MIYKKYLKRVLDLIISLLFCPLLLILLLIIGPMIFLEDKGPILYIAKRRGLNGTIFNMYKFRTMKVGAPDIRNPDNSTYNSENDQRVTRVGKLLRKTSLDEIPQLLNVIKGDMSIIGPRPITTNRPLKEYDKKRRKRMTVRPGITGYSQAYFRNSINQEEKLKYDAIYADNVTLIMDIKILAKTIQTVMLHKNIYNKRN